MGCMSAYYALAAVLHALPIGGTQKNSLDQQLCSMLIDGSATGLFFSTWLFSENGGRSSAFQFIIPNSLNYFSFIYGMNFVLAVGMTSWMKECRH